jgi:hypothetical protein
VSEDINDALNGRSGGSEGRRHGAKDMVRRFGRESLSGAVALVAYPSVEFCYARNYTKNGMIFATIFRCHMEIRIIHRLIIPRWKKPQPTTSLEEERMKGGL